MPPVATSAPAARRGPRRGPRLGPCRPCGSPSPSSRPASATSRRTWRAITSCSTRPGRAAPASSCSRSSGLTGYLLQDLAAEVAMRLDDPRLAALAARHGRPVGHRVVRRGVGGPPPVHRGGPARGRRDPPRPPQGVPADLRPVRRAAVLRPGRPAARRAVAARGGHRARGVRGLLAPRDAPGARARRGADPGQRVVVAGTGPGARRTRWASGRRPRGGR